MANKYDVKSKVYLALKTGPKTLDELQVEISTRISKKQLSQVMDILIKDGWIERYARHYQLKHVLGAPFDVAIRERGRDWNYERIQEAQPTPVSKIPDKWMNPFLDGIPHCDQKGLGTCCGFAGKYAAWLKQLELVDPPLDKTKTATISYDVPIEVFGVCRMLVDIQHEFAPSAYGLYTRCREVENVTHPTGCWIRGIAKAWKDQGYNYEVDWQTPKLATCAPKYYPLKGTEAETRVYLDKQGQDHKIEGYATAITFDGLKDAIYNYGCAIIAINMYDNCTRNGKVGVLPDPDGELIGSHALCAVGYDYDTIWFLHSWREGWAKINGISRKYYTQACGPAYVPIDSADVAIAQEIYGVITVTTNVDCEIWIGKDKYTGKTAKSSIEFGKDYDVIAIPLNPKLVVEPEKRKTVSANKDYPKVDITFTFTEKADKYSWIKEFIEEMFKKIRALFL